MSVIPAQALTSRASEDPAAWELLPEFPTPEELLDPNSSTAALPWFPIEHRWESKNEYLEALYRILRFEGTEGLRYSVKAFKSTPGMTDDENTCIYTKVRVKGYLFAKMGPIARISFSTYRAGAQIKWTHSRRLMPGKVVALSTDFFQKDCRVAVIAQRPIEGGLDQKPPMIDIIWADIDQAVINPDQDLVMVESRNGYYEAVRHALRGLQHAAHEWSTLDKYTVSLNHGDLQCGCVPQMLKLSALVTHLSGEQLQKAGDDTHTQQEMLKETENTFAQCNIQRLDAIKPYTSLDDSQLEAVQRIISKELSIIQGPPGTGKTFTSIKSIKVMLDNRNPGDPPIVIAAQTNHALDQLLLHLHVTSTNIMRIGGRTDNDAIKQRTVYELRRKGGKDLNYDEYRTLEKGRRNIVDQFENLVSEIFGGDGLLDPEVLLNRRAITEAQYNSLTDDEWSSSDDRPAMEIWLGGEKTERNQHLVDDFEFSDVDAVDEAVELEANLDDEQGVDDDDRIYGDYVSLSSQHMGKVPAISHWELRCHSMLLQEDHLFKIPEAYRGGVYQILQSKLVEAASSRFHEILKLAVKQAEKMKRSRWARDLHVIDKQCIEVIGCTTTGLTKYRAFLAAVQPRILLIEEAAETREANIASALFPSIRQLVLVGDHQQLPPSCDIARLGNKPYNLNISLFERLVENDMPYTMLNQQRRMAPELRYIVQQFYPSLRDHPLVKDIKKRPLIPGMGGRRSWFFTHEWPEEKDADNSKFNNHEADMIAAFVRYLLNNNVKPSEITILTYYKGQKRKIIQKLHRDDMPVGAFFNVSTVDSYQGEENEIVLLSLVRSPQPGTFYNVGFLDSRNRATVAISRARRGFFLFGNKINLLEANSKSFKTWAPVWNGFAKQRRVAMSKGLPLVCENHGNEIWVKDADGFVDNAGGCSTKCTEKLPCGHECVLPCHNIQHAKLPCRRPCIKVLPCGHKCNGCCTDPCLCAQNCSAFIQTQANMQMARVSLGNVQSRATSPASLATSNTDSRPGSGSQSRRRSPEKWQNFSQNPQAHDKAIREARLKSLEKAGIGSATGAKEPSDSIKDTFVQVCNINGHRILGEKQELQILQPSRVGGVGSEISCLQGEQSQQQKLKEKQGRPSNGEASNENTNQFLTPVIASKRFSHSFGIYSSLESNELYTGPPSHGSVTNLAVPKGRTPTHGYQPAGPHWSPHKIPDGDSDSGSIDTAIGFDAEVMGRCTDSRVPQRPQAQPTDDAEPLITFDDDVGLDLSEPQVYRATDIDGHFPTVNETQDELLINI